MTWVRVDFNAFGAMEGTVVSHLELEEFVFLYDWDGMCCIARISSRRTMTARLASDWANRRFVYRFTPLPPYFDLWVNATPPRVQQRHLFSNWEWL